MIIHEKIKDGRFIKTYSDDNRFVVDQNGVKSVSAVNPAKFIENGIFSYTEGEIIPKEEKKEL